MALITCNFFSDALGLSTAMTVILPQATRRQIGMDGRSDTDGDDGFVGHPTLYLLHGLSDDHTIWLRRTAIERYVAPLGLAVVMPAVQRSWYVDSPAYGRYWTFISEEVPQLARRFFRLSPRREDTFVAGLSMGGYGAFKLALRRPEMFAAAASLSGTLDHAAQLPSLRDPVLKSECEAIFGPLDKVTGGENDTLHLASRLAAGDAPRPRLYQCCGTDDFLYEDNLRFRDHARRLGLDLTWEEDAGYGHTWDYWDLTIQRVLKWLPIATPTPAGTPA